MNSLLCYSLALGLPAAALSSVLTVVDTQQLWQQVLWFDAYLETIAYVESAKVHNRITQNLHVADLLPYIAPTCNHQERALGSVPLCKKHTTLHFFIFILSTLSIQSFYFFCFVVQLALEQSHPHTHR